MVNKIFLLGAPATGKTTIARILMDLARKIGVQLELIDDNTILRRLCPAEVRSDEYYYIHSGELVLRPEFRDKIMGEVYRELALAAGDLNEPAIIEFTSDKFFQVLEDYFDKDLLKGSNLVYAVSSRQQTESRNRSRRIEDRVPDDYMGLFKEIESNQINKFHELFREVIVLENQGSINDLEQKCSILVPQLLK